MFACFESSFKGKVALVFTKGTLYKVTLWVRTAANPSQDRQNSTFQVKQPPGATAASVRSPIPAAQTYMDSRICTPVRTFQSHVDHQPQSLRELRGTPVLVVRKTRRRQRERREIFPEFENRMQNGNATCGTSQSCDD